VIEIPTVEGWLSGLRQRSCFGFGHPGLFHRVSFSSGLKRAHNRVAAFELFTVPRPRTCGGCTNWKKSRSSPMRCVRSWKASGRCWRTSCHRQSRRV